MSRPTRPSVSHAASSTRARPPNSAAVPRLCRRAALDARRISFHECPGDDQAAPAAELPPRVLPDRRRTARSRAPGMRLHVATACHHDRLPSLLAQRGRAALLVTTRGLTSPRGSAGTSVRAASGAGSCRHDAVPQTDRSSAAHHRPDASLRTIGRPHNSQSRGAAIPARTGRPSITRARTGGTITGRRTGVVGTPAPPPDQHAHDPAGADQADQRDRRYQQHPHGLGHRVLNPAGRTGDHDHGHDRRDQPQINTAAAAVVLRDIGNPLMAAPP